MHGSSQKKFQVQNAHAFFSTTQKCRRQRSINDFFLSPINSVTSVLQKKREKEICHFVVLNGDFFFSVIEIAIFRLQMGLDILSKRGRQSQTTVCCSCCRQTKPKVVLCFLLCQIQISCHVRL